MTTHLLSLILAVHVVRTASTTSPQCERLAKRSCFPDEATLAHNYTSIALVSDSRTQADVDANLNRWYGLRFVGDACWRHASPFLCALYKPPCDPATNRIDSRPCRDACERTKANCAVVEAYDGGWPDFTNCSLFLPCGENETLVANATETNVSCPCPLVRARDRDHWYREWTGCGLQCDNPVFDSDEARTVRIVVATLGSVCFVCTFFTLLTFLIDWKRQSQYPVVIIFYMDACFCIGSLAWLSQFLPNARHSYICRDDNTARLLAPTELSDVACVIVFALIYFFMMATVLWFVILAYAWDVSFQSLHAPCNGDVLKERGPYFHAVAWTLPGIKTILIIALGEVDGNSLSGVCFVGYENLVMRAYFVWGPLGVYLIVGGIFLVRGLIKLIRLNAEKVNSVAGTSSKLLRATVLRIGVFAFLAFVFSLLTFASNVYDYHYQPQWEKDFEDYVSCKMLSFNLTAEERCNFEDVNSDEGECVLASKPNVNIIIMQLCAMFLCGVAISTWVITPAAGRAWKKLCQRKKQTTSLSRGRHQFFPSSRVGPAPLSADVPPPIQLTHSSTVITTDSGVHMGEGSSVFTRVSGNGSINTF